MVGVPRSKGCTRCRKQKKGCDLKRPSCTNCSRIAAVCVYEAKKVQFIPSSTPAVQTTAVARATKTNATMQPWCLDKTALELEAEDAFWTAYLPEGGKDPTVGLESVSWGPLIRRFAHQDGLTRLAFQALSLTALGRLRDDTRLLKQGSELYTRALRRMNVTLKQPERARSDYVLATAQLLGTYEIFRGDFDDGISSQGLDWQRHTNGALQLVDLRIKGGDMTEDSWELLRHARESAIMSGGILSQPAHRLAAHTQEWGDRPSLHIQDELFDILYQTPQLLNDVDACLKSLAAAKTEFMKEFAIQEAVRVLRSAVNVAEQLAAWERNTVTKCQASSQPQGSVHDAHAEPAPSPSLFTICQDHGYGLFRTVMFYCWAVVPCYTKVWLTYRYLLEYAGYERLERMTPMPIVPPFMDPHPYALHICNNIPYFFRPEAGLWGAQQAVLPMGTALFYFSAMNGLTTPEPLKMIQAAGGSKGAAIVADFVKSVAALAAPGQAQGDMNNPDELREMAQKWFGYQYLNSAASAAVDEPKVELVSTPSDGVPEIAAAAAVASSAIV